MRFVFGSLLSLVIFAAAESHAARIKGIEIPTLPEETEGCINVVTARNDNAVMDCDWPAEWKVFGPFGPQFTPLPAAKLAEIPKALIVDGKQLDASTATAKGMEVNLMYLKPKAVARTVPLAAYCFGEFDSPIDGTLYVNMSADWRTIWYVDGKEVYNTMEKGNNTRTKQWYRRGFSVPITKGRHVVALLCQRNRWDWHFLSVAGVTKKPAKEMQKYFQLRRTVEQPKDVLVLVEDPKLEPAPPVTGTDAEKLIELTKPPKRFKDYRPRFRIETQWGLSEKSFTGQHFVKTRGYRILDGDKPISGLGAGKVAGLQEVNPLQSRNWPTDPKRSRWSCGTHMGTIGGKNTSSEGARYSISTDGTTVTAYHDWPAPTNAPNAWTCRSMYSTLRVDPVCGYVIDAWMTFEGRTPEKIEDVRKYWWWSREPYEHGGYVSTEFMNLMPTHLYYGMTKPVFDWRYEYTMYSCRFIDKFRGWVTDEPACQASDGYERDYWRDAWEGGRGTGGGLPLRDGGIVAFSKDPWGWTLAASRKIAEGHDRLRFHNATCHLLQDQHNCVRMKVPMPGEPLKIKIGWRTMNLPPEVTDYLLDRIELYMGDFITARQGEARDFESDKRRENGSSPWSDRIVVTNGVGRSGTHCAVFRGISGHWKHPDKPQRRGYSPRIDILPKMEYGVEYEIEGWVKVEGADSKVRFVIDPPHMDKKYWMGPRLARIDGKTVGTSPDWQKISIRFRNHDWHGWSVQPRFSVVAGAGHSVYLDDLRVKRVGEKAR